MMDDHLDAADLERFGAREMTREELFRTGWHLFVCAACRERLAAAGTDAEALYEEMFGRAGAADLPPSDDGVVAQVAERLRRSGIEIERERRRAPRLAEELAALPLTARLARVRESGRFRSVGLAEHLLAECRRGWSEDPGRSEGLAEVALAVLDRVELPVDDRELLADLKAEAWSYVANCRRIRSDLASVAEAFEIAEDFRRRGTGEALEEAALLDLKASFLRDQRRLAEAASLLDRVIEIYRDSGERRLEGRALIKQSTLLREAGEGAAAIKTLVRAEKLLDAANEPQLVFFLRKNLALYLSENDRPDEAVAMLPELRRLAPAAAGGRLERLRYLWVEGLVLRRAGQPELAETALWQVLQGFIDADIGYDAALVALDLAALLLDGRRPDEAAALLRDLLPIFTALDVHREALAALTLLLRAAEQRWASPALLEQAVAYLRRARRNPALRFEPAV